MTRRTLLLTLAIALLAPAFAGCLGGDDAAVSVAPASVAETADDAGAQSGEAPAAPRSAYRVGTAQGEAVAYPVGLATNPAKAPITLDFSAEYRPQDCRGLNFGSLESQLKQVSDHRRFHDLREHIAIGDVFAYEIEMAFTNTDTNWAEIHPYFAFGSTHVQHDGDIDGDVVLTWAGQSHRTSDDDPAFVGVRCYYGAQSAPVPYTLTVRLSFADGAVPAEVPVLVPVPEGATRLMVRGVPIDPAQGVQSHFRLFAPDESLVCECALGSQDEAATVELDGPGDYVLLVDHTGNGFVSVALDAPPLAGLRVLETEWYVTKLFTEQGGPADKTLEFELASVPLHMHAEVWAAPGDAGAGQNTKLTVSNARGEPLSYAWAGHLSATEPDGGGMIWLGLPSVQQGAWDFTQDHHAYSPGAHTAHLQADSFRGDVWLVTRQYVR